MVVTYCFKDIIIIIIIIINVIIIIIIIIIINVIIINVIIIIYLSYIISKKSKSIWLPEIRTSTIGLGYFGQ